MFKPLLVILPFLLGACSSRFAELGVVSPDLNQVDIKQLEQAQYVKNISASSTRSTFLFFTLGSPSLEEAVRSALNNSESDILVNLKAERRFSFGFPLGEDTISVKADGIKLAPMFGGFDD